MNHQDTRVLILGVDGYLGWALHQFLKSRGYRVEGYDNYLRRAVVKEIGSDSLIPIDSIETRGIQFMDVTETGGILKAAIASFKPHAIVHLAELPSAPYSMMNQSTCRLTQINNLSGTLNLIWSVREVCPEAHIIKLGTMGEYGDNIYEKAQIPESSRVKVGYPYDLVGVPNVMAPRIHTIEIPTPRWSSSFYHWSKTYDSFNLDFATRLWNLRVTDVNQGPVYGTRLHDMTTSMTRFDYDDYFGTVVNRFCVQAMLGIPLTVYGKGGQIRGYINLNDSMRAIEIAINHPPEAGKFRVVNQITEVFSINEIALLIKGLTGCVIGDVSNPRVESEEHEYEPKHRWLRDRGLNKFTPMHAALGSMLDDVDKFKHRAIMSVIQPRTRWIEKKESRNK